MRRTLTFAVDDLGGASLPPSPGATIRSTMANASGTASDCPGGRLPCRVSSDFTLTFDTVVDGVGVTGSYVIRWVDGSTSEDVFDAMWCVSEPGLLSTASESCEVPPLCWGGGDATAGFRRNSGGHSLG